MSEDHNNIFQSFNAMPLELMEILNKINDNINEVKIRITRLESQNHSNDILKLENEIKEEREQRIAMKIELATLKQKIVPIVFGISIIGAGLIEYFIRLL